MGKVYVLRNSARLNCYEENSEICAVCVLVVYSMEVKPGGCSGLEERFGCKARRINTGVGRIAVRF